MRLCELINKVIYDLIKGEFKKEIIGILIFTVVVGIVQLLFIVKVKPHWLFQAFDVRVEAVFMILDEPEANVKPRRRPHVDIVGKTQVVGDIMDSVPESDWDMQA